jgi:peptidylprolyl isomerase
LLGCDQKPNSTHSTPAPQASVPSHPSSTGSASAPAPLSDEFPPPADLDEPPASAQRSSTGLFSQQLRPGSGNERLTDKDYADTRFTAWRADGSLFATTKSGLQRLQLSQQIAGLREALLTMALGEQRRLWIPYALAFGSLPHIRNAPKTDLVYDLELVKIARQPKAPDDVAAPPVAASKTATGLRFRIVAKGQGTRHPSDQSRVELRYSAFTPDGKMFESSVPGGDSTTVQLKLLMEGWREGLKLMVEGERRLLWIPANLANGELTAGQPALPFGPPKGPLVFDVELLKILAD